MIKTSKAAASPGQKRPPGPHDHWLLGSAHHIQSDPIGFNMSMMQRYGNVVSVRFLFWPTYMIFHPNDVKHVLQEKHALLHQKSYPSVCSTGGQDILVVLSAGAIGTGNAPWITSSCHCSSKVCEPLGKIFGGAMQSGKTDVRIP